MSGPSWAAHNIYGTPVLDRPREGVRLVWTSNVIRATTVPRSPSNTKLAWRLTVAGAPRLDSRCWCLASRLPAPREMRSYAKQSLDHHQLPAVMHFVFFGVNRCEPLGSGLAW